MSRLPFSALLLCLSASTLGCNGGDDKVDPEATDSGTPVEPECIDDDACEAWEVCEAELCEPGDHNNSLDEAESLLWEQDTLGYLATEGDQDFFTFQAEGGEFVRVSTEHTPEEHEGMNTIVSLYSPTGQLHHQEDDHAVGPVTTYDTVLYAYLPDAGEWTVVIEDVEGAGDPAHSYTLSVQETGSHTREDDSFESPSYDLDADQANRIWAVGVALEEPADVDWVDITLPWEDCPIYVRGSQFTGGTDANATVELYTPEGQLLMHKEDLGPGGSAAYFEVDGRSALLSISDSLSGGGEDFWTFIYVTIGEQGYGYTYEEEDNSLPTLANRTSFEWDTNEWGNYGASLHWGLVDEPGDADWFLVEMRDQYYLTLRGSADGLGSMMEANVDVYDATETLVATAEPGDDSFDDLYNLGPLDEGLYYVRITSDAEGVNGPEYYYRVAMSQSDYELATN